LQPSKRLLSGLNAADISRIQHRLLEVIRSGQPRSYEPAIVVAGATEKLTPRANDNASDLLLKELTSYSGKALAQAMRNIEHIW